MRINKIVNFIIPNLLVLPIVLRWLLPVGIEYSLYINFDGVYFFLLDLLYIPYLIYYRSPRGLIRHRGLLVFLLAALYLLSLLLLLVSDADLTYKLNLCVNNFSFLLIPFIYVIRPIGQEGFEKIKYTLTFALIVLCFEVILYSTGILVYTTTTGEDLTDGLYDTGGIMRISTTIGAATGSAIIIMILGCIVTGYYKFRKATLYILIILVSVTLLFTISRGSILVWILYLSFYFLKHLRRVSFSRKLLYCIVIGAALVVFDDLGFFEPLKNRMEANKGDQSTGRDDLNDKALNLIESSDFLGVGIGHVYPEKIIQFHLDVPNFVGMHNTYLTYLAEIGFVGLMLLIVFYIALLSQLHVMNNSLSVVLFCILLVNFNTEAVFVDQEFISIFYLLIVASFNIQFEKSVLISKKQKDQNKVTHNRLYNKLQR